MIGWIIAVILYIVIACSGYKGVKKSTKEGKDPWQRPANIVISVLWPFTLIVMFVLNHLPRRG